MLEDPAELFPRTGPPVEPSAMPRVSMKYLRIARFALWTMRFNSLRFLRNQARRFFGIVKVTWK
jgi:hypothetical protein